VRRAAVAAAATLALAACGGGAAPSPAASPGGGGAPVPDAGRADVGGYDLAYACEGQGTPVVILEAGLGAAGTETFFSFVDRVAGVTRVCAYDRAGTGSSDDRPDGAGPVTAGLMARELHALLAAIGVEQPVVLAAHSYGGMVARAFEGAYPQDVAGLVLLDVSSEPEVPVYERLDAGPWIDRTDRIDMDATVRELAAAGDLGDLPVVVVTAELIDDPWLATVPKLAARAQARLASLSTGGFEVVAGGSKHFVHEDAPDVVATAIRIVVEAAGSGTALPVCEEAFADLAARCIPRGGVPDLIPAA
jgi:pimeloyl-ACP methyl ester carboxylesterase